MRLLDLFSGIGGFSLGLERTGVKTIAFCEMNTYCQSVLRKHWPHVPIASDIHHLTYENGVLHDADRPIYYGRIDIICGGFPCQPFSVAGRREGTADHRDLWPQMFRVIKEVRPTFVIGENVIGFLKMAFSRTKADLESAGYAVQALVLPACAIGAPHRRDRVWILGYAEHDGSPAAAQQRGTTQADDRPAQRETKNCESSRSACSWDVLPHADDERFKGSKRQKIQGQPTFTRQSEGGYQGWRDGWPVSKPRVCGVDDGIPNRTQRLIALGNAVLPHIPEILGHEITKLMEVQS